MLVPVHHLRPTSSVWPDSENASKHRDSNFRPEPYTSKLGCESPDLLSLLDTSLSHFEVRGWFPCYITTRKWHFLRIRSDSFLCPSLVAFREYFRRLPPFRWLSSDKWCCKGNENSNAHCGVGGGRGLLNSQDSVRTLATSLAVSTRRSTSNSCHSRQQRVTIVDRPKTIIMSEVWY